ncbi:ATP-binding protein, partial [Alicyclobacillus acidiphilus]
VHLTLIPLSAALIYGGTLPASLVLIPLLLLDIASRHAPGLPTCVALVMLAIVAIPSGRRAFLSRVRNRLLFANVGTIVSNLPCLVAHLAGHTLHRTAATDVSRLTMVDVVGLIVECTCTTVVCLVLEGMILNSRTRVCLAQSSYESKLSAEQYQSLVRYNPNGICAFDRAGQLISANSAYLKLAGWSESELLQRKLLEEWFAQDQLHDILQAIYRGRTVEEIEGQLTDRQQRRIDVRYSLIPTIVDGEIVGFYGIVRDVSKAKMAEELLRKTEKLSAVGELAAGIAHEIRNPLTAIHGFLKLMMEQDGDRYASYYHIIRRELGKIEAISGELLTLAHPTADQLVDFSITTLLQDVRMLLQNYAAMHGVKLWMEISSGPMTIHGELSGLKQALINVTRNAIESMSNEGTVLMRAVRSDGYAIVEIIDQGVGMSDDTIRRLGEPFFTNKNQGAGLGLMVTHQIVRRHGGDIHYDSKPHEGTKVTIRLPIGAKHQVAHRTFDSHTGQRGVQ